MIVYRIRNKKTGLFSPGGSHLIGEDRTFGRHWNKKGKIWRGTGPLRKHLKQYLDAGKPIPDEWEVVAYEVTEEVASLRPAKEYIEKPDIKI